MKWPQNPSDASNLTGGNLPKEGGTSRKPRPNYHTVKSDLAEGRGESEGDRLDPTVRFESKDASSDRTCTTGASQSADWMVSWHRNGQHLLVATHGTMHWVWKRCLQRSFVTYSPISRSPRHIAHVELCDVSFSRKAADCKASFATIGGLR